MKEFASAAAMLVDIDLDLVSGGVLVNEAACTRELLDNMSMGATVGAGIGLIGGGSLFGAGAVPGTIIGGMVGARAAYMYTEATSPNCQPFEGAPSGYSSTAGYSDEYAYPE